jgi:hypothetical protein
MMDRAIAQRRISGSHLDVAASQFCQRSLDGVSREATDPLDAHQFEESKNAIPTLERVQFTHASVAQALVSLLDVLGDL